MSVFSVPAGRLRARAVDPDHEFRAQLLGGLERGQVGIDHALGHAVMVAQVDEQHAAVVADAMAPAGEADGLRRSRRGRGRRRCASDSDAWGLHFLKDARSARCLTEKPRRGRAPLQRPPRAAPYIGAPCRALFPLDLASLRRRADRDLRRARRENRDRGILHRRARRRAADRNSRLVGGASNAASSPIPTRRRAKCSASPRRRSPHMARSARRRRARWRWARSRIRARRSR